MQCNRLSHGKSWYGHADFVIQSSILAQVLNQPRINYQLAPRNKLLWKWNTTIFIQENSIQNFAGAIMPNLFRPRSWWRHQMETFTALLAIFAGNSPVTGEFPTQRPVTRSFDVFFDLRLNKQLSKNREAGDLRRHRAHYGVTVMMLWWNITKTVSHLSTWKNISATWRTANARTFP